MTTPHTIDNPAAPGSDEWATTITASKVPPMITRPDGTYAGYGYLTAWEQFESLKGRYNPEYSDYMLALFDEAHKREEPAVQQWVERQERPQDWEITLQEAWTNPALGFDNYATLDARAYNTETGETRILEVKSPITGGQQPGWIMQITAQHVMSGINSADLIIWPFSAENIDVHHIDLAPALVEKVTADMKAFNALLTADTPPPGGDIPITDEQITELKRLKDEAKKADEAYKAARDKLTRQIEQQEGKRATHNGERVATVVPGRFAASRVPDEYADVLNSFAVQKTVTKLDEAKLKKMYPWVYAAGTGDPYITLARNI